jgi:Eco29kI restriction endonuclease
MKDDLSAYCGAYLLYYQGDFSMYNLIKQANLNKCCMPIYVGKAAPGGRRTGRTTIGNTLYGRLSEHRKSIAKDNFSLFIISLSCYPNSLGKYAD